MAYYNNEQTFEDWYKKYIDKTATEVPSTYVFERKEDMSDAEYDAVSKLYSAYGQNLNDRTTTNNEIAKVNNLRNSANQQEYIAYEKLKKYLPTQLKAQGLGGLGVSETALLQAYNNHSQNLGTIRSEYDTKVSDLENAYGKAVNDRNAAATADAKEAYDTKIAEEKKEKKEAVSNTYEAMKKTDVYYDVNGNLTQEGYNALLNYLETNKDVLGSDYDVKKTALGESPATKIITKGASIPEGTYRAWWNDEKYEEKTGTYGTSKIGTGEYTITSGDNFTVGVGDEKYKVQIAGQDNEVLKAISKGDGTFKVAEGETFGYGTDLYIKLYGQVYKIEGRPTNKGDYKELYAKYFPKSNSQ